MTSLVYFCGWDYLWVVWKSTLIIIIFTPTCFSIASVVLPLKAKLSRFSPCSLVAAKGGLIPMRYFIVRGFFS